MSMAPPRVHVIILTMLLRNIIIGVLLWCPPPPPLKLKKQKRKENSSQMVLLIADMIAQLFNKCQYMYKLTKKYWASLSFRNSFMNMCTYPRPFTKNFSVM